MPKKSKAIRKFLNGLSHQIPLTSVTALLQKTENDALVILLNSSIEALPMGSPIRKFVDEDLFQSVLWLREELEKRSKEAIKETAGLEEYKSGNTGVDDIVLPALNPILFQHLLQDANDNGNADAIKKLQYTDYATPEIMVISKNGGANIKNILSSLQASFAGGQLNSYSLDSFVGMFQRSLLKGKESASIKMNVTKSFIGVLHVLFSTNNALLRDMDLMAADDLGKIVGYLASLYFLFPEVYANAKAKIKNSDDDNDDDGDCEGLTEKRRKHKARKMSDQELEQAKRDCQLDFCHTLSNFYILLSRSKRLKTVAASFTIGLINTILMEGESETLSFAELGLSKMKNTARKNLAKEASVSLIESMGLSGVISRSRLPSSKLISDGKKRCIIIRQWAQSIVKSIINPLKPSESNDEDTGAPDKSTLFVVDKFPGARDVIESGDEDENSNEIDETSTSDLDVNLEENAKKDKNQEFSKSHQDSGDGVKQLKATAAMMLPPVPEEQEAVAEASVKISSVSSPGKAPAEPASVDTPSRMTRSRRRNTTSVETSDSEDSMAAPSRKRTRKSARKEETSDDESANQDKQVPPRRSRRKTSILSDDSDGSQVSFTLRRSARKKK